MEFNFRKIDDVYVCEFQFSYDKLNFIKSVSYFGEKWRFDWDTKHWYTKSSELYNHTLKLLTQDSIKFPELKYPPKKYQEDGFKFLSKNPFCILADEMGLGKTYQTIAFIKHKISLGERSILILCPLAVAYNWKKEIEKFTDIKEVYINELNNINYNAINIVNYEKLYNSVFRNKIKTHKWDVLICDESHKLKNKTAKITLAVLGSKNELPIIAKEIKFLTGTPILNRPDELYPILHRIAPTAFKTWSDFVKRYCSARLERIRNKTFLKLGRAQNLEELHEKIKGFYIRRTWKELGYSSIIHKTITLPTDTVGNLLEEEKSIFKEYNLDYKEIDISETNIGELFTKLSKIRAEISKKKVPYVIECAKSLLDEKDKIVVFFYHVEAANMFYSEMLRTKERPVLYTGETSKKDREHAVDRFMNGNAKVFVGTISAAGTGINLNSADTVIMAEHDWRPGIVNQAIKRIHRVNNDKPATAIHLIFDGSVDSYIVIRHITKDTIFNKLFV